MTGRVFVEYPRGRRTGGPEALHQLVDSLRRLGREAYLVPVRGRDLPRVPDYRRYDAPEAGLLRPGRGDDLVVPEAWLGDRGRCGARVATWWLSVDNARGFQAEHAWATRAVTRTTRSPAVLRAAREAERLARPFLLPRLQDRRHLAQSRYAADFVATRLNLPALPLSDYVTGEPVNSLPRTTGRPVVSFLEAKSGRAVEAMRSRVRTEVDWLPIAGMTPQEVRDALLRSQVFLDLGRQPGKDRMPREAAAAGAVTLLLETGAGANPDDFPIPAEHRISLRQDPAAVLDHVLGDLPHHHHLQDGFRAHVAGERVRFDAEVRAAFPQGAE